MSRPTSCNKWESDRRAVRTASCTICHPKTNNMGQSSNMGKKTRAKWFFLGKSCSLDKEKQHWLLVKLPKNPCSKFLASYWSWSEWKRNKWRSFPPMPGPMPRPPPRVKVSDGNLRKEIEWKKSTEKSRLSWDVGGLKNPERNPRQIITWSTCSM